MPRMPQPLHTGTPAPAAFGTRTSAIGFLRPGLKAPPPAQSSHLQTLLLEALRDVVQAAADALLGLGRRLLGAAHPHGDLRPVWARRHLRGATHVHLAGRGLGLCRGERVAEDGQRFSARDHIVLPAPVSPGNQFHEHPRLRSLWQRHSDGGWVTIATQGRRRPKRPKRTGLPRARRKGCREGLGGPGASEARELRSVESLAARSWRGAGCTARRSVYELHRTALGSRSRLSPRPPSRGSCLSVPAALASFSAANLGGRSRAARAAGGAPACTPASPSRVRDCQPRRSAGPRGARGGCRHGLPCAAVMLGVRALESHFHRLKSRLDKRIPICSGVARCWHVESWEQQAVADSRSRCSCGSTFPKAPGAVAVEADGRKGGSQCAPLDGAGLYDLGLITPCSRAHWSPLGRFSSYTKYIKISSPPVQGEKKNFFLVTIFLRTAVLPKGAWKSPLPVLK